MASEIALTHPFLRPGTSPLSAAEQRREAVSRTTSTVLVAALHVLFFFAFVFGMRPFDWRNRPIIETMLILPQAGNNEQRDRAVNPIPMNAISPNAAAPPITIPKPPPIREDQTNPNTPGSADVLGAVGRELACSAGSWEHLTMVERQRCGIYPWRGMRLPNGTLVMVPKSVLPRLKEAPDTEFSINTGADQLRAQVQAGIVPGQGCSILQNTPCMHVTPAMRAATGDR